MEYKVLPFHPTVTDTGGAAQAANELQTIINAKLNEGWHFKGLESMTTNVKATGCASGQKAQMVSIQLLVFERPTP